MASNIRIVQAGIASTNATLNLPVVGNDLNPLLPEACVDDKAVGHSADTLCSTCESFAPLMPDIIVERSFMESDWSLPLWDLQHVFSNTLCPICRLLKYTIIASGRYDKAKHDFVKVSRLTEPFYYELDVNFGTKGELFGPNDECYSIPAGHCIQLMTNPAGKHKTMFLETARDEIEHDYRHGITKGYELHPTTVDLNLVQRWLRRCETLHSSCQHDRPLAASAASRLIDIRQGCIVPVKSEHKYVALSYVWGSSPQFRLLTTNYDELHAEMGLFKNLNKVPKTIVDAISFCQKLGEDYAYLWVDSLCIIQDSAEDKRFQISSMADVYSRAAFTLIAAAGPDANAGLPPITGRRCISQHIETIPGAKYISTLPASYALNKIFSSTWLTRGWTLQEYALSLRKLIVTDTHVFFRCRGDCFFEGNGEWSARDLRISLDQELPCISSRSSRLRPGDSWPSDYSKLVGNYLKRNLGDPMDIINAFDGILKALFEGDFQQMAYFWGLPRMAFGGGLQWLSDSFWYKAWPRGRREGFPSWSWAGWHFLEEDVGCDWNFVNVYPDFHRNNSLLTFYYYNEEDQCIEVLDGSEGKPDREFILDNTSEQILSHFHSTELDQYFQRKIDQYLSNNSHFNGKMIFFWTSHALLHVKTGATHKSVAEFYIYPTEEAWHSSRVLSIYLDPIWRKSQPEMMEFIVINSIWWENVDERHPGLLFKIMLVQRVVDGEFPIYERVGIPRDEIFQKDWLSAKPQRKLIILV